jgi:Holliday junction resolvase
MTNKNRARGDRFEHLTRDALRGHGWVVVRSAGSLGPADLVALRSDSRPWLVSCKATDVPYLRPAEWIVLWAVAIDAGAVPVLAWKGADGPSGIEYRALLGPKYLRGRTMGRLDPA